MKIKSKVKLNIQTYGQTPTSPLQDNNVKDRKQKVK